MAPNDTTPWPVWDFTKLCYVVYCNGERSASIDGFSGIFHVKLSAYRALSQDVMSGFIGSQSIGVESCWISSPHPSIPKKLIKLFPDRDSIVGWDTILLNPTIIQVNIHPGGDKNFEPPCAWGRLYSFHCSCPAIASPYFYLLLFSCASPVSTQCKYTLLGTDVTTMISLNS